MAIFGLGSKAKTKKSITKKTTTKGKKTAKQSADAKAVLKRMQAKQDAGDCAFC